MENDIVGKINFNIEEKYKLALKTIIIMTAQNNRDTDLRDVVNRIAYEALYGE